MRNGSPDISPLRRSRPPKEDHDPWRPLGQTFEDERQPDGRLLASRTVFLVGAECPYTCVFCDLWRYTLDGPTPAGAIARQLDLAIGERPDATPLLKLYNASNFFDSNAVPSGDDAEILRRLAGFEKIVVECHAKLVSRRAFAFAERLEGKLQIAIGWETVHPRVLPTLGKGISVAGLQGAAARLNERGIAHRAFLLIGAPGIPPAEDAEWVARSCAAALEAGAEQVVLIPLRLDPAQPARWPAPTLEQVEDAARRCAALDARRVLVDLWDLERCPAAGPPKNAAGVRQRLADFNLSGQFA